MRKKLMNWIILIVFLSYICINLYIGCIPKKYAITALPNAGETYIVAMFSGATDSYWKAIGDEQGMFDESIYIQFIGEGLPMFSYGVETGGNIFICYGSFLKVENDICFFEMNGWDILYPVSRREWDCIIPVWGAEKYLMSSEF